MNKVIETTAYSWKHATLLTDKHISKTDRQAIVVPFFGVLSECDPDANPLRSIALEISERAAIPIAEIDKAWRDAVDLSFALRIANGETGMPPLQSTIRRWVARLTGAVKTDAELNSISESMMKTVCDTFKLSCTVNMEVLRSLKAWRSEGLKVVLADDTYLSVKNVHALCKSLNVEDCFDFSMTSSEFPSTQSIQQRFETEEIEKVTSVQPAQLYVRNWMVPAQASISLFVVGKQFDNNLRGSEKASNLSVSCKKMGNPIKASIKTVSSHPALSSCYRTIRQHGRK